MGNLTKQCWHDFLAGYKPLERSSIVNEIIMFANYTQTLHLCEKHLQLSSISFNIYCAGYKDPNIPVGIYKDVSSLQKTNTACYLIDRRNCKPGIKYFRYMSLDSHHVQNLITDKHTHTLINTHTEHWAIS